MVGKPSHRRLKGVLCHVSGAAQSPQQPTAGGPILVRPEQHLTREPAYRVAEGGGLSEQQLLDYTTRGFIVLTPQQLGTPEELHRKAFRRCVDVEVAAAAGTDDGFKLHNYSEKLPELMQVLNSPGVDRAVASILGDKWAIVPWTHNMILPGSSDQHWHKDDSMPYNARRPGLRQHQPQSLDLFWYPQTVTETMSPTAFVPYSQYSTFDHDENQDHWAIEMLDNNFWLDNWPDHPDVKERDFRLQRAVNELDWPLTRQVKVCVPAGSIVLMPQNLFHRRTRRLDGPGPEAWRGEGSRFMWRFWLYRTTEPEPSAEVALPPVTKDGWLRDPITAVDEAVPDDISVVWDTVHAWMRGGEPPPVPADRWGGLQQLAVQIEEPGEGCEWRRIGAAYKLGNIAKAEPATAGVAVAAVLGQGVLSDRESVRRAATYGLVTIGEAATSTLLSILGTPPRPLVELARASSSPPQQQQPQQQQQVVANKWARKNALFALGEVACLGTEPVRAICSVLASDPSVYLRATAAMALGDMTRRALTSHTPQLDGSVLEVAVDALLDCCKREHNRQPQATTQRRGVYSGRPTDECDICEGGSMTPPHGRFKSVRSAVKENALWSLVVVASHAALLPSPLVHRMVEGLRHVAMHDECTVCCLRVNV